MKQPVDHILRPSLPWRQGEGAITECGYDASKVQAITREEFIARTKELGMQRTAMLTCMTCSDTARRWCDWETEPRRALEREIVWETGGGYYRTPRSDRGERLKTELLAIVKLIENHRDEFDAEIMAITQRAEWLKKKDDLAKKPRPTSKAPLGRL